ERLSLGAAWSPDGKTIAYAALFYREGGTVSYHLETIPAEGGPARRIGSYPWLNFRGMHWLPNGRGLIVLAGDQVGPGGSLQLWRVSYPDGEARRITNDLNSYQSLSLNADGSALVSLQVEARSHIWVASMDNPDSARQLTQGRQDGICYMAWTKNDK